MSVRRILVPGLLGALLIAGCTSVVTGSARPIDATLGNAAPARSGSATTGSTTTGSTTPGSTTPTTTAAVKTYTTTPSPEPNDTWALDPLAGQIKGDLDRAMDGVDSVRMDVSMVMPGVPVPMDLQMRLEGLAEDSDGYRMWMSYVEDGVTYEMIAVPGAVYARDASEDIWLGYDADTKNAEMQEVLGELDSLMQESSSMLSSAFLLLAEDAELVGGQQLDGVSTQRYSMRLNLNHIAASGVVEADIDYANSLRALYLVGMREVPTTIWLDQQDRMAQMQMDMAFLGKNLHTTARFTDYGKSQGIKEPADSQVQWQ